MVAAWATPNGTMNEIAVYWMATAWPASASTPISPTRNPDAANSPDSASLVRPIGSPIAQT